MLLDEIKKREKRQRRERNENTEQSHDNIIYECLDAEFMDYEIFSIFHGSSACALFITCMLIVLGFMHSYQACLSALFISYLLCKGILGIIWMVWSSVKQR